MENSLTITSVLSQKIATYLARRSFRQMIRDLIVSVCISFAAGLLVNANLALAVIRWHNGIVPTLVLILTVEAHARWLFQSVRGLFDSFRPEVESIDGIPTVELLDHLFTAGTFRQAEVKKKLGAAHHKIVALGQKLESIGVLFKDRKNNNALTLNPDFSRQDIASILEGCETASDIEPLFRRDGNRFTSEPSGKDILARVEESLTPPLPKLAPPRAPGFITRLVSAEACLIPAE